MFRMRHHQLFATPLGLLGALSAALLASVSVAPITPITWQPIAVPAAAGAGASAAAGPHEPHEPHAALANPIYLPIALARDTFAPPPAPVTSPPTSTTIPTSTPTQLPTEAPLPFDTPLPTPTPSPSLTPDDRYSEPLTQRAALDDLKNGYNPNRWYETLLAVLERRYGTGYYIVTHLTDSKAKATVWTNGSTGTFADLLSSLELAVHEMNHQLGFQEGFVPSVGKEYFYQVRADKVVRVKVVPTFNRDEIAQFVVGPLENQYKTTYLTGQSGQQGFFNLLDEFNAYTHSLFTGYGLYDQYPHNQRESHRDGLVTFMMYTQFYLRQARLHHVYDYNALRADPEVKALVKLLWDRANFILDTTADIPSLALNPAAVEAEMRKADMQAEIEKYLAP